VVKDVVEFVTFARKFEAGNVSRLEDEVTVGWTNLDRTVTCGFHPPNADYKLIAFTVDNAKLFLLSNRACMTAESIIYISQTFISAKFFSVVTSCQPRSSSSLSEMHSIVQSNQLGI
jgi:hypothetical protein